MHTEVIMFNGVLGGLHSSGGFHSSRVQWGSSLSSWGCGVGGILPLAGQAGRCEQLLRQASHSSWPALQINSRSLARSLETCEQCAPRSFLTAVFGRGILEKSFFVLERGGRRGLSWAVPVCLDSCALKLRTHT